MDRKYIEANRQLWKGWTEINRDSKMYDLEGFKAGKNKLKSIELDELEEVDGKTMLHLQCHFGLDSLSWARMGAKVTGVDFSEEAINLARSISDELNIDARFIHSELFDLPNHLDEKFDIVFTSYGVLTWLDDLKKWAELIARYLKLGGTFYIVELHPFLSSVSDDGTKMEYPYFNIGKPLKFKAEGSYSDPNADFTHDSYEWSHSLGEIVTSLIDAGLKLEYLHEFPYSPTNCNTFFRELEPGKFVIKDFPDKMPLTFSIKATI
jgi:ubiquinone/menaquinone biosynthesis C-methylase UbiE